MPDGPRLIFDKPEKVGSLADRFKEVEQLSSGLAREINPLATYAALPRYQVLNGHPLVAKGTQPYTPAR